MSFGGKTLITDGAGNKYYTVEEALNVLEISRSTFDKRVRKAKVQRFHRPNETKFYYRVEDIQRLKEEAEQFLPVEDNGSRAALAFA